MNARALTIAVLLLCASGARHVVLGAKPMRTPGQTISTFPLVLGSWRSTGDVPFTGAIESILGVDEYVNRVYQDRKGDNLGLYVGYYRMQRQGAAIHSPLNCLPGAGWQPLSQEHVSLAGSSGPFVNKVVVQKGEFQQVVYYWYQTSGRIVASEYWSKFYLVSDSITQRRSDAALVRVVVPIGPNAAQRDTSSAQGLAFASLVASSVRSLVFESGQP
jgi:EpsI family protein